MKRSTNCASITVNDCEFPIDILYNIYTWIYNSQQFGNKGLRRKAIPLPNFIIANPHANMYIYAGITKNLTPCLV